MRASFLFLSLAISTCAFSVAQNQSCDQVTATSDSKLWRTFLAEENSARRSLCTPIVIKRLGELHDVESISLLVRYLDYMDPRSAPRPDGGANIRPSYPAMSALFLVGKPATRDLLHAIQNGESEKLRENAAKTYMFVYRDDLAFGISLLKKERVNLKSAVGRTRLNTALQLLVEDCSGRSEQEKQSCQNVIRQK